VVTSIQLYMRVTTNMAAGQFDNIIRKWVATSARHNNNTPDTHALIVYQQLYEEHKQYAKYPRRDNRVQRKGFQILTF
jgi:hypothetical protein